MKKISTHSKTSLFLMEMIFVLLFLSLSSAACIRIFAAAKENQKKAQEWRHIQMLTTSVSEILEAGDGNKETFLSYLPDGSILQDSIHWYYDASWNLCPASQASYEMILQLTGSALVKQGNLSFYKSSDHVQLYTTMLSFPALISPGEEVLS